MILDVGCGPCPKGDVNVDLFYGVASPHIGYTTHKIEGIPNFVKASAEALPFRDESFTLVHASHLMEHLKTPYQFLREAERVSYDCVYIQVPALLEYKGAASEYPEHIYTWCKSSLENLLKKFFTSVEIHLGTYQGRLEFRDRLKGRLLGKMGILGRAIWFLWRELPFRYDELTAICRKKRRV
jgi:hypothetical protein